MTEFSCLGGHPAIDFVNTQPMRNGMLHEYLSDYGELVRWAEVMGIIDAIEVARLNQDAATPEAKVALSQVRALREALRDALPSLAIGQPLPTELIERINRALVGRIGSMSLFAEASGWKFGFSGPLDGPAHLVAAIAHQVADLLTSGNLTHIRRCEGSKCVLWFIDTTRNQSRHWCRMDRCGARAKAAAYYRRRHPSVTDAHLNS